MKSLIEPAYFLFLFVTVALYWQFSRRLQNIFLLFASYLFYAFLDYRFLWLVLFVTGLNYFFGLRIHLSSSVQARRTWLIATVVINLGLLGYFKYVNFFMINLTAAARMIGWHLSPTVLSIMLPVGMSFYLFQALTYPLDIYRNKLVPTRSLLDFAAFVAFFPKIVAGPIVRASDFMAQLSEKRAFSWAACEEGCIRIITGYFKKVFIADTLALYLVNPVFNNPALYTTGTLWLAMFGYSIQIYADFSGYSNMAIGAAKILGLSIPENFKFPYLAKSFSDFWRRWHITMSTFFRDYVYIPLGGSRCDRPRILYNLMVTMVVCGLWHGAAWTFIAWGAIHGLYLAVGNISGQKSRDRDPALTRLSFAKWFFTVLLVTLAWIPFRSPDMNTAMTFFGGLIGSGGEEAVTITPLLLCAFIAFACDHGYGWMLESKIRISDRIPSYGLAVVYVFMLVFAFNAHPEQSNAFIYFQF